MSRRPVRFECEDDRLFATLDTADGEVGLLIVSGGNEIRSGAWSGQAQLAAQLGQPPLALGRDVARGDHNCICPLQPLIRDLSHLHRLQFHPKRSAGPRKALAKKTPAAVVRAEGFEPPRLAPPEPKSGVSANSTTPASHRPGGPPQP